MTTATTGTDHHHHWVLVDGYNSVYECACGATRGDRNARPDERPTRADGRRRRLPRVRLAHRS